MAKLTANRKNYEKAFRKHVYVYENWNNQSKESHRLLLCYCVECGLKYLIMYNNRLNKMEQANDELSKVLGSHDLKKLLKEVRRAGVYKFENFVTEYGESVRPSDYHQLCRYCILPKRECVDKLEQFNSTLEEIKDWLKEEI